MGVRWTALTAYLPVTSPAACFAGMLHSNGMQKHHWLLTLNGRALLDKHLKSICVCAWTIVAGCSMGLLYVMGRSDPHCFGVVDC